MRDVKKHRIRLYIDARGLCHYCGCKTVFPTENSDRPDMATIDHLYSRFHPYRKTPNTNKEKRHVLSCYQCNQLRARLEEIVFRMKYNNFILTCKVELDVPEYLNEIMVEPS